MKEIVISLIRSFLPTFWEKYGQSGVVVSTLMCNTHENWGGNPLELCPSFDRSHGNFCTERHSETHSEAFRDLVPILVGKDAVTDLCLTRTQQIFDSKLALRGSARL